MVGPVTLTMAFPSGSEVAFLVVGLVFGLVAGVALGLLVAARYRAEED